MFDDQFSFSDDIHAIKYYRCPYCHHSARLYVDFDTDSMPALDDEGRYQYFCLHCGKTFSVETNPPPLSLGVIK